MDHPANRSNRSGSSSPFCSKENPTGPEDASKSSSKRASRFVFHSFPDSKVLGSSFAHEQAHGFVTITVHCFSLDLSGSKITRNVTCSRRMVVQLQKGCIIHLCADAFSVRVPCIDQVCLTSNQRLGIHF